MEWLYTIIFIILLFGFFMWCFCKVSSESGKKEEQYRSLDAKKLDDEQHWENDLVYDDEFVEKEDHNEK